MRTAGGYVSGTAGSWEKEEIKCEVDITITTETE